jgi:hypothetical protein
MSEFYLFRSTTPNLTGHLQHIEESGDSVISMAFVGEKHWIIVCRKGYVPPMQDHFIGTARQRSDASKVAAT